MSWLAMSDWFLRSKEWDDWAQIDDSNAEVWLRNVEFFVDRTYTISETFVDWERWCYQMIALTRLLKLWIDAIKCYDHLDWISKWSCKKHVLLRWKVYD